ncbi:unnamed protein product [Durusdinium trenchii]|uniref:Uncharacterized protein n=2 Tax=Durusdinium trenchii TaxID=1381693 RepID=A0ABP0KTA4_9DINO
MPWRDRSALKLLAIFWWSLCVRARGERASAMLVEVQRSMMQAVGDEPPHEKEHVKKPNCLQPCDEGCFCNPAKHYEGIYFCDCTGRSSVAEHIYRQEEAYADLIKHPDKKGKVNPEWTKTERKTHLDDSATSE